MELKAFQERVLAEVSEFMETVAKEQRDGNRKHASQDAWDAVRGTIYRPRRTGHLRDLPDFCIKVPTGGGKTLLATQIVGIAYRTLLSDRNGTGLVLWVVPSDQIYKDTLKALRDRGHFYRQSLEFAVSRKVEVWEKQDIARITPAQMAECLNVLLVKLPGTNRMDRESLKFFRDSGGNIVQHFPPEDDPDANRALKDRIPNLDMLADDASIGECLVKTSLGNLVRLYEPVVILDEGHKATSELARQTIEGFNPAVVVELSATPTAETNVLSKVSGMELLNEEMIKLPINVANSRQATWKNCLTQAKEKRDALAASAEHHYYAGGQLIRPIVLVQVERTGRDQREAGLIHSEDVREYLVQRLGIPENKVKVKTSETDDLEGVDLMDEECPVEWIVTKSALQEGWDCPFAYILVSLSNTQAITAMTQLVGRILRQPFIKRTPFQELNECYVYCLREKPAEVLDGIRKALIKEGYEGSLEAVVDRSGDSAESGTIMSLMRDEYSSLYGKPFEGEIYLPRFVVQTDEGPEPLDYFRHLLAGLDIAMFDFAATSNWNFSDDAKSAKERFARVNLGEDLLPAWDIRDVDRSILETPEDTRSWLVANLGGKMEWFSAKQLRFIVNKTCENMSGVNGDLPLVRFSLLSKLEGFIEEETDKQTARIFEGLYAAGRLSFFLMCNNCAFKIPPQVKLRKVKRLVHEDNSPVLHNLFDYPSDEVNQYEKKVALCLDNHPEVLWWYRNMAAPGEFDIQGYRRHRIRPDFVVQRGLDGKPKPTVFVVESKGAHLKGNLDTDYKRLIAERFTGLGKEVTWQELGEGFDKRTFRFQILDEGDYPGDRWREELDAMLTA